MSPKRLQECGDTATIAPHHAGRAEDRRRMSQRLAAAIVPLALYCVAVVWLTWPLAAHLRTHLPSTEVACSFDTLLIAWVLAWQTHALATAPLHFAQANIYHPARHALFYCEAGVGALPYYAPAFLLTGSPALALNVTLLAGVALTAWALHLVVRRWTSSHLGGTVAAWTFLTTRWVLWEWGPVAPNYVVLPYFPLIVLLVATPAARLGDALRLVPLLVLQGLTSIYVAAAAMIPVGLIAAGRLVRRSTRASGLRLAVALSLGAAVLLVGFAGYLVVRLENPDLQHLTVWRGQLQPPTALPWGPFGAATAVPVTALALIVVGGIALACGPREVSGRFGHAWLHAVLWSLVGLLLSFSPEIRWYGMAVTLPTVHLKPLYDVLRVPCRLGVAGLIGLSLLAGLGWATAAASLAPLIRKRVFRMAVGSAIVAAISVCMYAEYAGHGPPGALRRSLAGTRRRPLPSAYPIAPVPALSRPILQVLEHSRGPLLEVPVGRGVPWPAFHAAAMYRSTLHWRPLLNGYSSYYPAGFGERMTIADRLPDADALTTLRRETGLDAILVHLDLLRPAERSQWLSYPPPAGLRLVAAGGDDLLFAVGDGAPP